MTAQGLLDHLRARGATLNADGGELRCRAPRGLLTAELRALLVDHKTALLALLEPPGPTEPAPAAAPPPPGADDPPPPSPEPEPWTPPPPPPERSLAAALPMASREAWGRRANELEEVEGLGWRDAEARAFDELAGGVDPSDPLPPPAEPTQAFDRIPPDPVAAARWWVERYRAAGAEPTPEMLAAAAGRDELDPFGYRHTTMQMAPILAVLPRTPDAPPRPPPAA